MGAVSSFPKDKVVLKSWSHQGQVEHFGFLVSRAFYSSLPLRFPGAGVLRLRLGNVLSGLQCCGALSVFSLEMVPSLTEPTEVSGRKGLGMSHF